MDNRKKNLIVCLVVGLMIAGLVIIVNWSQQQPIVQRLCDGAFVQVPCCWVPAD